MWLLSHQQHATQLAADAADRFMDQQRQLALLVRGNTSMRGCIGFMHRYSWMGKPTKVATRGRVLDQNLGGLHHVCRATTTMLQCRTTRLRQMQESGNSSAPPSPNPTPTLPHLSEHSGLAGWGHVELSILNCLAAVRRL